MTTTEPVGQAAGEGGTAWTEVCPVGRLVPGRGVTALVAGQPVAVFVLPDRSVAAVDDVDPFSGAAVLSRGIVGDAAGQPTVASPVYKQRFELRTGRCLDDDAISIRVWPARVRHGMVEVAPA